MLIDPNDLMTAEELAEFAGINYRSVSTLVREGLIRPITSRRYMLFTKEEAERYKGTREASTRADNRRLKERFFHAPIQDTESVMTIQEIQEELGMSLDRVYQYFYEGWLQGPVEQREQRRRIRIYRESFERLKRWREGGVAMLRRMDKFGELPSLNGETPSASSNGTAPGETLDGLMQRNWPPKQVMVLAFDVPRPKTITEARMKEQMEKALGEPVQIEILSVRPIGRTGMVKVTVALKSRTALSRVQVPHALRRDLADWLSNPKVEWSG